MNITLTPELIAHCKTELQIKNDFVASETVTANHVLFQKWQEKTKRYKLPKLIFYIIMDEEFGQSVDVDSNNNLGRKLNVKL